MSLSRIRISLPQKLNVRNPMKKLLVLWLVLTLTQAAAQTREEREVLTLSRKKFGWLIRLQADSLSGILDEKVQYIHSNGWIQTKKEVLEDMRSGKLVYQNVTVKEDQVRVYGKTAIVTGLGTFEGINNGTAFKLDLRYTEVYLSAKSGWMLLSRHSNRMP